jgi:CheY-like chemotaxis protein
MPAEAGSGLGLAISRQFVELMGGKLAVDSTPGKGSVFHFEIPVTLSDAPKLTAPVGALRGQVLGLEPGQRQFRLLVAEDQPDNRLLLHKLLEPLGFELRDALNGQEAVAQFEQWHPDLILMDIRMPVMDGIEATRRIRAMPNGAKVPIVALTAHALGEERLEILAAGCDDFVRKPFRESEIYDVLTTHLQVRFRYAEHVAETQAIEVDIANMRQLPPELLEALRKAVELLDHEACIVVAGQISDINYPLGLELRQRVESFRYKELLNLLDQINGEQSQ